jgi:outer membrane receptor for ferrienterochelin and colicins
VPSAAAPFVRLTTGASRERSQTSAGKLTWPVGETHTLAAGWDLDDKHRREVRSVLENGVEQLLGFEGEPFAVRVERQALWLQDEWAISDQWSSVIGVRSERILTTGDAGQAGSTSGPARSTSEVTTPLLHLTWKPDPKRRDLVRFGLNRSYRAPETQALMARPSISASYPASGPNVAIAPDRVGNPALKPELSTGLDIAFERYLDGGAVASLGLFHRRIEGLIRPVLRLQAVSWSPVPRWVSLPDNLDRARSTGIEAELKGKLNQWWPGSGAPDGIAVRASLGWYRSTVDALPGPDNRLEGQQPWSLSLGIDQVINNPGWAWGASLQATPAYAIQQTVENRLSNSASETLEAYVLYRPDRQRALRLGMSNLNPRPNRRKTLTAVAGAQDQTFDSRTTTSRNVTLSLSWRFD